VRSRPFALVCLLALGCAAAGPRSIAAQAVAPASDPSNRALPPWMLPIVRSQMARHRELLNELRWTAASLEFGRTGELARGIAREVHCGRPADDQVRVAEVIPAPYLELQEELGRRAYHLAVVATSNNRRAVTAAYGELVESCGRCHARYRTSGPPLDLPTLSER
jgi:cytochrome c553